MRGVGVLIVAALLAGAVLGLLGLPGVAAGGFFRRLADLAQVVVILNYLLAGEAAA
jgi:hypothetical protein